MAHITSVEFGNADTISRKGFIHAFHTMFKAMLTQKRAGDSVMIHFDDGTSEAYKLLDATISPNHTGWVVSVEPGIET